MGNQPGQRSSEGRRLTILGRGRRSAGLCRTPAIVSRSVTITTKRSYEFVADDIGKYVLLTGHVLRYETKIIGVVTSVRQFTQGKGTGVTTELGVRVREQDEIFVEFRGDDLLVADDVLELLDAAAADLRGRRSNGSGAE